MGRQIIDQAGDDSTEGHAIKAHLGSDDPEMRSGRVEGDGTDTEGHGFRAGMQPADDGDDREGRVVRRH